MIRKHDGTERNEGTVIFTALFTGENSYDSQINRARERGLNGKYLNKISPETSLFYSEIIHASEYAISGIPVKRPAYHSRAIPSGQQTIIFPDMPSWSQTGQARDQT